MLEESEKLTGAAGCEGGARTLTTRRGNKLASAIALGRRLGLGVEGQRRAGPGIRVFLPFYQKEIKEI